jgi:hypothetical protein
MFLARRIPPDEAERGSALIGVMALLAITAIITLAVGTASTTALRATNGVAASLEARGAAEAGVNHAEVYLRTLPIDATCDPVIPLTADHPKYSVQIQYRVSPTSEWISECPPTSDRPAAEQATSVRFLSTGLAKRPLFGSRLGESSEIEAIYNYFPKYVTAPDTSGAALYAWESLEKNNGNGSMEVYGNGDVFVRTGKFDCLNGSVLTGNLVVTQGPVTIEGCTVSGTIHVGGGGINWKSTGGGSSALNVISTGPVELNSGTVTKSVDAGGSVLLRTAFRVGENVVAGGSTATVIKLENTSQIGANAITSGTIERAPAATIGGIQATYVEGLLPPPPPVVPDWYDVGFVSPSTSPATFSWGGQTFDYRKWPEGDCEVTAKKAQDAWRTLIASAGANSLIIDAMNCKNAVPLILDGMGSSAVSLQRDVVVFSRAFSLGAFWVTSTSARRMMFITPDNTPNNLPTCLDPQKGNLSITTPVFSGASAGFAYTPCTLTYDRRDWVGQFYAGKLRTNQQGRIQFKAVAPAWIPLSSTLPAVRDPDTRGILGERTIMREVATFE